MSMVRVLRHTPCQSTLGGFPTAVALESAPAFVVEIAYFAISGLRPPQLTKPPTSAVLQAWVNVTWKLGSRNRDQNTFQPFDKLRVTARAGPGYGHRRSAACEAPHRWHALGGRAFHKWGEVWREVSGVGIEFLHLTLSPSKGEV